MMRKAVDPVGPLNDEYLCRAIRDSWHKGRLLVAWGNHGSYCERSSWFRHQLYVEDVQAYCLAKNKTGEPKHPVYCSPDSEFQIYMH